MSSLKQCGCGRPLQYVVMFPRWRQARMVANREEAEAVAKSQGGAVQTVPCNLETCSAVGATQ